MSERHLSQSRFGLFDADTRLDLCGCGTPGCNGNLDQLSLDLLSVAAVRALFPQDAVRRNFIRAVGSGTALAAISAVLPLEDLQAMAADTKAPLEKKSLKIAFLPISCSAPLILADPLGLYRQQGLEVSLMKSAGWAIVRDQLVNGEMDAAHLLAPMPLAMSLGLGSTAQDVRVASMQNINGNSIALALKHKDNRDPKHWKGMKFAIPFEFSMHNFLLRYYLAEKGIDPDRDVQLRVTPPPEMLANLRAGNIDGFIAPDSLTQRAVYDEIGFIHLLTKDIWDGHPCCGFGVTRSFIEQNPNSFAAMYRAILAGIVAARDPKNRSEISKTLAQPAYLNQPEIVIRQALTGRYADGLGKVVDVPDRGDFGPLPWYSMATWMLTQMRRWGYIKEDIDYRAIAERVFMLTDARRQMEAMGLPVPEEARAGAKQAGYRKPTLMGKPFDPAQPKAYVESFAIRRS